MYIIWKDPNMRLHGKRHKRDSYYFRWHYGKQRIVHISHEYIDKPTQKQQSARDSFTVLRKEVARQLHDPTLRARWEARFRADKQGYKMLHTYVYAMLKQGESVTCNDTMHRISASTPSPTTALNNTMLQATPSTLSLFVVAGTIIPIFNPQRLPQAPIFTPQHVPKVAIP